MPDGHVFGHIRLAHHLTFVLVGWAPRVADEEGRDLFCGVAVIVSKDMGVGLQKEADVGMADPLADHLRVDAGFERTGGVGVPQIMEGDPRESCGRHETVEALSDCVGVGWPPVLESEYIVAGSLSMTIA
jgi:hypothetical protein